MNKIRIAFVKFNGLTAGGSEKLLQIIAVNLPKDRFEVSYFYCDYSPTGGSTINLERKRFMEESGVRLVEFTVGDVDRIRPWLPWKKTNFWDVFNESKYDLVQTCRWGLKEYPFYKMNKIPLVDLIGYLQGVDNQYNIARVMHITNWSAKQWVNKGGDASRVVQVSLPIMVPEEGVVSMRQSLHLENIFVYGFHQRPDDDIFSPIPLAAYQRIEDDTTAFVMLGGSKKYQEQAQQLGLRHAHFLPSTGDQKTIISFLKTLDVYAHGRRDGEINSQAMAEAMYFGLPIVSHLSSVNNGHVECIGDAGRVVDGVDAYAEELKKLHTDDAYYMFRSNEAKKQFANHYELTRQMKRYVNIYEAVVNNPFPQPLRRFLSTLHYSQHVLLLAAWGYHVVKKIIKPIYA